MTLMGTPSLLYVRTYVRTYTTSGIMRMGVTAPYSYLPHCAHGTLHTVVYILVCACATVLCFMAVYGLPMIHPSIPQYGKVTSYVGRGWKLFESVCLCLV